MASGGPGAPLAAISAQGDARASEPAEATQQAAVAVPAAVRQTPNPERGDPSSAEQVGSVARFMLACMPRSKGEEATLSTVYARYRRWCAEVEPVCAPLAADEFAAEFRVLAGRVGLLTTKRGKRIVVSDVRVLA
jgi:hypothetical protein